jgi:hypothetical protein
MTPDRYRGNNGGSCDPKNPQSWNRYAYTTGDPVNYRDPKGLFIEAVSEEGDDGDDDWGAWGFSYDGCMPTYDGLWGGYYGCGAGPTFSTTVTAAFASTVPLVANVNSNKQSIFKNAFNTAYNLLNSPKCDSAFGNGRPANVLQGLLQNANYMYGNVTSQGNPIPSDDVAVTTPYGSTVTINSAAITNFFGTSANSVLVQGDSLSLSTFRAFVLLHELGHMVGFGTLWDSDSAEQELPIDCFGLK